MDNSKNNSWDEISDDISDVTKKIKDKVSQENLVDDLKDSFKSTIDTSAEILKNLIKAIDETVKDEEIKLESKEVPPKCYEPIPHEKAGNMKLPAGCVFCSHKVECHKDANEGKGLRAFKYASGNVYFTHIAKEPKVEEVKIIEK